MATRRMVRRRAPRLSRPLLVGVCLGMGGWACDGLTDPELLTLFVAPELSECVGVGPQTCMLVRESPGEDWRYFYGSIEGFEFEPGFFYELRVRRYRVGNPPADGSAFRYILLRIVSKIPEV